MVTSIPTSYDNPFAKLSGVPLKRDIKNLSGNVPSRLLADFRVGTNTDTIYSEGGSSVVYFVQHRLDGMFYAIKQITKGSVTGIEDLKEVHALAAVGRHPNIVGYYSSWLDNEQLWMQLEKCDDTLKSDIQRQIPYEHREFLELMADMAAGLAHIHACQIAHLDIKPENIFFLRTRRGKVFKIGDFGQAVQIAVAYLGDEGDSRYYRKLGSRYAADQLDLIAMSRTLAEVSLTFSREIFKDSSPQIFQFLENPEDSIFLQGGEPGTASDSLWQEVQGALHNLADHSF
jgi:wee1-like protein kinase